MNSIDKQHNSIFGLCAHVFEILSISTIYVTQITTQGATVVLLYLMLQTKCGGGNISSILLVNAAVVKGFRRNESTPAARARASTFPVESADEQMICKHLRSLSSISSLLYLLVASIPSITGI